jgi:DUF2997 family protein
LSETPKEHQFVHGEGREALRFLVQVNANDSDIGVPAEAPAPTFFLTPLQGTLMPRIIEVIVSPQGEVTLQTKGYAGSDCLQASKFLEQALGVVSNDQKTTEFFETETTQQHLTQ